MTSCHLALSVDGLVRVRWRSLVSFPPGANHLLLRLTTIQLLGVDCKGGGCLPPAVVRLGRRAVVHLELDDQALSAPEKTDTRCLVELAYVCRPSRQHWSHEKRVWCLRDALPRLYWRGGDGLSPVQVQHTIESNTRVGIHVSLTWDGEATKVFGPNADPASGAVDLVLSDADLANYQLLVGSFKMVGREAGLAVWLPGSNQKNSPQRAPNPIALCAARVHRYLTELFGVPTLQVLNILLTPEQAGFARYFGSTVLIRDPRDAFGEISAAGEAGLLAQLAHELSHGWWVPVVSDDKDKRVRGLIEGIAVASEFLVMKRFLPIAVQNEAISLRRTHHSDLVTVRLGEHIRHYKSREAGAGLRFGHVLLCVDSSGLPVLRGVRHLLHSFKAAKPKQDGFRSRMEESFGSDLSRLFLEILDEPRPPIASVRFKRDEQQTNEVHFHFRTRVEALGFLRLLTVSKAYADKLHEVTQSGRKIQISMKPHTSDDWLQYLTPGFVVYRRVLQWNRVERIGLFRKVAEVAWALRAQDHSKSIMHRFKCASVGLAEILIESEAGVGYELVATALEGWMTPLAKRLREAASRRANW